jgi:hypothetical protein
MYNIIATTLLLLTLSLKNSMINAVCAPGCSDGWPGDNICDAACYNAACNWDGGDCTDDNTSGDDTSGSCNVLTCPNIWDGQCGAFNKPTDKWCDYDGAGSTANVCCADDYSECCEADGAAIGGTVAGAVVFLIFCFWYCRRRRDNTNDTPPNCAYKSFCPPCAVFGYQGCESKTDGCMTCCLCSFFTLFCWEPKKVVVDNNNNNETIDANNIPHVQATQMVGMDDKEIHRHV